MDQTMPIFDENMMGGGLNHGLPNSMPMNGADTAMTGMIDPTGGFGAPAGGDMMNTLDDLDLLPMNLDGLDEDPLHNYSPVIEEVQGSTQQQQSQRQLSQQSSSPNQSQQNQQQQASPQHQQPQVQQQQAQQQQSKQPQQPSPQQQLERIDSGQNGSDANGQDSMMTGAGAGPLPASFGAQAASGGSSTLTEFTKRRNWSQRVLEELQDFLHILTPDGRLIYVSQSCKLLTGHAPEELVNKFIMNFIHPDDSQIFMREFNESISSGNPLRFFYRFRKSDGRYAIFESHGHPHLTSDASQYAPPAPPPPAPNSNNSNGNGEHMPVVSGTGFCRGFFMMSRPYPTKNAALLDSFLEHKTENERLLRKIAELKREEQEEIEAAARHAQKKADGRSDVTPSETLPTESGRTPASTPQSPLDPTSSAAIAANAAAASASALGATPGSMPPPAKPSASINNHQLTRQNLDEANAKAKPDSISDKMERYSGSTTVDTIEIHTGLHYGLGERALGLSTGDESPCLIPGNGTIGDVGISIPADKDGRGGGNGAAGGVGGTAASSAASGKQKKIKMADEYVCTDCGTLDSPEWRKGPQGPKTLCNACGLRWAKKEKKKPGPPQGSSGGNNSSSGGGGHGNPGAMQVV